MCIINDVNIRGKSLNTGRHPKRDPSEYHSSNGTFESQIWRKDSRRNEKKDV